MSASSPTLALALPWLRGARRRPVRALAVIGGLAVMAAATVGALVGGDALEALFVADARAEWGEVDLEARADDNAVHELSTGRLLQTEGGAAIEAAAPRLILQSAVTTPSATEPGVQLLGLGAEEQLFTPLTPVAGSADVLRLDPDEVIVNQRLAQRLDLQVGQQVGITVAVPRWLEDVPLRTDPVTHAATSIELPLTVAGIVADAGVADLHRVPSAMLRRDTLGRATGLDHRVTVTHLRVADRGPDAEQRAVDALAHLSAVFELDIDPVALQELALAEEDGGLFRSILLTLSVLVVAAAVVASRGLLVTLAEERAGEISLLRALGARRRQLARLIRVEAAAYGIAGAALGAALGVPFGRLLARLLADHFASLNTGRGREQVALQAGIDTLSIVIGGLIVLLVAILAGRSAARLVLRAPIGQVLRGGDLVPPPLPPSRRRAVLTVAAGAFLLGMGVSGGGPLVYLGVTVLLLAWWMWARASAADRDAIDQRAGWAGLAWAIGGAALFSDPAAGVQAGFGTLTVAGVVAITAATVLLVPRLRGVARWVRTWVPLGPGQASLIVAGAQAEAAARRSATTVVTIGAVLFMVAALSVLGSAQALPTSRQAGGFDVLADSVAQVDTRELRTRDDVAAAVALSRSSLAQTDYAVRSGDGPALTVPYPVRIAASSSAFAGTQGFRLAASAEGFPDAAAALGRLARERGAAVVDRAALPEGAWVGDHVVIDSGLAPRRLRLIGILDTYLLSTVFVNEGDLAQVAQLRGPNWIFATAAEGTTPEDLAASLEEDGRAAGVSADTVEEVRADVIAVNRTFTDTFAVMLLLGLAVAITSVAAYVVRAARERRAELAVLVSLGMRRRAVVVALAAEPVLSALTGAVLGVGLGIGVLRVLFAVGFSDLAFVVDWPRVALAGGGSVLLLAIICAVVAQASAPRRIAEALRDLG